MTGIALSHPPVPTGLGPDRVIRWFATRQAGVVSRAQMLAAGLTRSQIDGRIARGILIRMHQGVYDAGAAPLGLRGRLFAALLSGPPDGVISHRSAAVLRGLLPDRPGPVHVTSGRARRPHPGVLLHRSTTLVRTATVVDGIPCASIPRTLVDVAATEGAVAAERAWSSLSGRRALDPRRIEDELRRSGGRRGTRVVRMLLERHRQAVTGRTRSTLEDDALRMCARYGLPMPRSNHLIEVDDDTTYAADLAWVPEMVVAELDDWSTHGDVESFRNNRRRDFDLELVGWKTVRLLGHDVTDDAAETADRLERLLARRRAELDRAG
ncbi:type IV toxin-antitoxin system AbiEi family antitoxin domain-containing protein [Patulibacter sp. NPDC049589]|uniref:type IV toxin-antitoxin system AbiEi family antitoxin domain-containing protein n=1 Tax=Patulibacter sp. NPDC049589 TaxID=3154731 RepID=UPI00341B32E8